MLHDNLIILVMLCYYQALLVNVYVLRLNKDIPQYFQVNNTTYQKVSALFWEY